MLARAPDLHFASPVNAAAMMTPSSTESELLPFYMAFDGEMLFWLFTGTVMAAA
ncbi:hypothetical protein ACNKHW_14515 [Shigella flexneri]